MSDSVRLNRTSPKAKRPVKTTPITVSSLIRLFCLMKPVLTAQKSPATKAPIASGMPAM